MTTRWTVGALWLAALCGCGPESPTGPVSLVPSDYARRFSEVRNCRGTTDHAAAGTAPVTNIRVMVSPEAAAAYRMNAATLPAGTLVIKEESDDPSCGHVTAFTVMRKEPGYDSAHGDWHWQRVRASDRAVLEDGRLPRCFNSGCHGAAACTRRDWMCTDP